MKQVTVRHNDGREWSSGPMKQDDLQAWISKQVEQENFGKASWIEKKLLTPYVPAVYDEEGNITTPSIEATYEDIPHPAEYVISPPEEVEDPKEKRERKVTKLKALKQELKDKMKANTLKTADLRALAKVLLADELEDTEL